MSSLSLEPVQGKAMFKLIQKRLLKAWPRSWDMICTPHPHTPALWLEDRRDYWQARPPWPLMGCNKTEDSIWTTALECYFDRTGNRIIPLSACESGFPFWEIYFLLYKVIIFGKSNKHAAGSVTNVIRFNFGAFLNSFTLLSNSINFITKGDPQLTEKGL